MIHTGTLPRSACQSKNCFFCDGLKARSDVGIAPEIAAGRSRLAKKLLEFFVVATVSRMMKREIAQVEFKGSVGLQPDQATHFFDEPRLTKRRHAHNFVLALIHFKAE